VSARLARKFSTAPGRRAGGPLWAFWRHPSSQSPHPPLALGLPLRLVVGAAQRLELAVPEAVLVRRPLYVVGHGRFRHHSFRQAGYAARFVRELLLSAPPPPCGAVPPGNFGRQARLSSALAMNRG